MATAAATRRLARPGDFPLIRRSVLVRPDAATAAADCQLPSRTDALISSISSSSCPQSVPSARSSSSSKSGVQRPVGRSLSSSSASPPPPLPPPPPPHHRVNPPDATNPDPVTLQEQWRYATRMYSTWYAHAWGTAILAGLSFYGLGWFIKGENPLQFGTSEKKEAVVLKPE